MACVIKHSVFGLAVLFIFSVSKASGDDSEMPPSLEQQKKEYAERIHAALAGEQKSSPNWYAPSGKFCQNEILNGRLEQTKLGSSEKCESGTGVFKTCRGIESRGPERLP